MKHTKQEAGKKGGLSTVRKHGKGHMSAIGKKGARVTWQRYHLQPAGTSDFAMVRKDTGEVIAFLSGKPWG
jgi:general stress protein YciG